MQSQRITLTDAELDAVVGQPSAMGHPARCVWCGHVSSRGEHEWTVTEDARGWECADESACRARFDAAGPAS